MGRTYRFHCNACDLEYQGSIGRDRGMWPGSERKTLYCRACERPRVVKPHAAACPECTGTDVFEWPALDDQPVQDWMPSRPRRPHVRCPRCDEPVPVFCVAVWD